MLVGSRFGNEGLGLLDYFESGSKYNTHFSKSHTPWMVREWNLEVCNEIVQAFFYTFLGVQVLIYTDPHNLEIKHLHLHL